MRHLVCAASLASLCACSGSTSSSNGCRANADCRSGQVCVDGACETVCAADNQCAEGEICRDSTCAPGTRDTPNITGVDGDDDIICPDAGGTHCLDLGIVVDGSNLEGAAFEIIDTDSNAYALTRRDAGSDTRVSLYLPDVARGDYVLRATNAAGSDQAALTLLQGPQGVPGVDGSPDTAAQVLAKLVSVDGDGSGLDADLLDGTDLASLQTAIDQAVAAAVPIGTVVPFAGASDAVPTGWLLCDGAAIDRTTYADLFAVIGIAHGGGNGTTTFNLPDYRGRFLRGVDHGATRDPDVATRTVLHPTNAAANRVGSVQGDAFGSHSHYLAIDGNPGVLWGVDPAGQGGYTGTHNRRTDSSGSAETRPKNAYVNWILKI